MKYLNHFLSICFFICSVAASAQQSATEPGQLLVQIPSERAAIHLTHELGKINGTPTGLEVAELISGPMKIYLLTFDHTSIDPGEMLKAVEQHPAVTLAQFNHRVKLRETLPNDPQVESQW